MNIVFVYSNKDGYTFKINNSLILDFSGTAISTLGIVLPTNGTYDEMCVEIQKQFDFERFINNLFDKFKTMNKITINSGVCLIDDNVSLQTDELKKYLKN
jgi:hypothetical protein